MAAVRQDRVWNKDCLAAAAVVAVGTKVKSQGTTTRGSNSTKYRQ
jgi:hypothetical protein